LNETSNEKAVGAGGKVGLRRFDILERLITRFGYTSYLEIGVAGGATFRRLSVTDKTGVDPRWRRWSLFDRRIRKVTSDRFFAKNRRKFDLVLVDGLHIAEQTWRDIQSSLEALREGGSILVHDCLPTSRSMQEVPRTEVGWTGDVWRAFLKASQTPGLSTMIFDTDRGCGLIRRDPTVEPSEELASLHTFDRVALPWEAYDQRKHEWIRIVPREQVETALGGLR
jgi:hypothetical protein